MEVTHKGPILIAPEEEDFITNMPDNVVTNILDRLPIQDAVRTGILARKWRFKWNMLSQLVFDDDFFEYLSKTGGSSNNYGSIISRLLFHLNGTITKFVLHNILDDENTSHWILFLSKKGIKDLSLVHDGKKPFKLPIHLFSCLELKHLTLYNCCFNPPRTFLGFPNLLSLELATENSELGEFIARCPLLEKLILCYSKNLGKVNLAEIAQLKNLKVLSFSLSHLNTKTTVSSYNVFELLDSLPKLQELHLHFKDYKLTEGGAKKRFDTAFPSLKALELFRIDLGNGENLSCAFELIKSCPNLQTLEISTIQQEDADPIPIPEVEYYNITGLERLGLQNFKGSENEVYLIKYLFACSPLLQKIVICPHYSLAPGERLMFARKLLKLRRASALAEIDFS